MTQTVIVLGGGVAGMSAAHELIERGFAVRVFEMRDVPGGKARSVVVPSTVPRQNIGSVHLGRLAAPTRRDLPGEHGFRFFPRFYKHVIDTMERIPYGDSGTVADNLVDTRTTVLARFGRRPSRSRRPCRRLCRRSTPRCATSARCSGPASASPRRTSPSSASASGRSSQAARSAATRSTRRSAGGNSSARRDRSEEYQKLFAIGLTRSLVAAQAKLASTKTIGDMYVQYFFNLAEPDISADRVLNGPTNDVWIDPWLAFLHRQGVDYRLNTRVRAIEVDDGVVRNVTVEQDRRITRGACRLLRRGPPDRGHGRDPHRRRRACRSATRRHLPAQRQRRTG